MSQDPVICPQALALKVTMEDTQRGKREEGQPSRNGVHDHKGFVIQSLSDSMFDGMGDFVGRGGGGGGGRGRGEPVGEEEEAGQGLQAELQGAGKSEEEEEEVVSRGGREGGGDGIKQRIEIRTSTFACFLAVMRRKSSAESGAKCLPISVPPSLPSNVPSSNTRIQPQAMMIEPRHRFTAGGTIA